MRLDIRKLVGKQGTSYEDPLIPVIIDGIIEEVDIRKMV